LSEYSADVNTLTIRHRERERERERNDSDRKRTKTNREVLFVNTYTINIFSIYFVVKN